MVWTHTNQIPLLIIQYENPKFVFVFDFLIKYFWKHYKYKQKGAIKKKKKLTENMNMKRKSS